MKTPYGATGALVTQGGGVYVHNNVRGLQRHRQRDPRQQRLLRRRGAGRARRTPATTATPTWSLARNQIRDNGGTNLAGGIGIFNGSDGYRSTGNAICGNFSAEYGGAMTAFGYKAHTPAATGVISQATGSGSTGRTTRAARVMVAGELPADPTKLSPGTGPVTIDGNVIQANLANDDGGGIRLLQTSGSHITRVTPGTHLDHQQHRSPTTSRPTRAAASPWTTRRSSTSSATRWPRT